MIERRVACVWTSRRCVSIGGTEVFGVLWSQGANFLDNSANAAILCFMISCDDMFVTANQWPFDFVLHVEHFTQKRKKRRRKCLNFHSVLELRTGAEKKSTKKRGILFGWCLKATLKAAAVKREFVPFLCILAIWKLYGCLFVHVPKLPCNWVRYCGIFFFLPRLRFSFDSRQEMHERSKRKIPIFFEVLMCFTSLRIC